MFLNIHTQEIQGSAASESRGKRGQVAEKRAAHMHAG